MHVLESLIDFIDMDF